MKTIELQFEGINKEQLFEIAKDILLGADVSQEAKDILNNEDEFEQPTIESMKSDLDIYTKIVQVLSTKIEEEEKRRKKFRNHLIEKKIRTTVVTDEILEDTDKCRAIPKRITNRESIKYIRENDKTICTISSNLGVFIGECVVHKDDEYNYQTGKHLSFLRARKEMASRLEQEYVATLQ